MEEIEQQVRKGLKAAAHRGEVPPGKAAKDEVGLDQKIERLHLYI